MKLKRQAKPQTAKLALASLGLLLSLHCNVYDSSLLEGGASSVGGTATTAHSGTSGRSGGGGAAGRGGSAGEAEAGNVGLGGFAEMAGANESGGTESGGNAGETSVGGANGGASGATAGSAGVAGAIAGAGGAHPMASGCAKLSVPLDDGGDKAHFVISLASPTDLSGATISMRLYVQAGQGGTIFNYVQDSGTFHFLGVPAANRQPLSSASGWSTISWNVGSEPDAAGTGIVKASIKSIGIEINAQPSSTWSNPTIVYVDSITVQSPALSFTFDASGSVSTNNTAGALWLNGGASDTTASGAAINWQATCP